MNNHQIWCVIPVYNNARTVKEVATKCRSYLERILVVDDGSTDIDVASLFTGSDITVIEHDLNSGKGAALRTALRYVLGQGGSHMISIDADAQHLPEDLPLFIAAIEKNPADIIVGCRQFDSNNIPASSKFGRRFSNLWFRIESGASCHDTQSGYRAYPVATVSQLKLFGHRYDFEVEVLTRAVWAGLNIQNIDVNVHYEPVATRISHFNKLWDNIRISLMHTRLVTRSLMPWPHKRIIPRSIVKSQIELLKHPITSLKTLLKQEDTTPLGLAAAAAVGTFLAVLPLIACHTIAIIYVATRLHLNKIMAVAIQNLYAPPLVPAMCIWLGYFMRNGHPITDFHLLSLHDICTIVIIDWLLGSLILAPLFAIIAAAVTFIIATLIRAYFSSID